MRNLYDSGKVYVLGNGELQLQQAEFSYTIKNNDGKHIVTKSDTLRSLANRYYEGRLENPENYWFIIALVNEIYDPFTLPVGKTIVIPSPDNFA